MGLADRDYMRAGGIGNKPSPPRPQRPTWKQQLQFLWWRIRRWLTSAKP